MGRSLSPLDVLRRHEARGDTGEFIAIVGSVEVHVFMQKGRVAWAVNSDQPLAFVHAIKARCQLDHDVLREVTDECRRDRLPLGETLVRWGLASVEQVRAALSEQLRAAVVSLGNNPVDSSMFLERARFREYDPALTFALVELLPVTGERPTLPRATVAPDAAQVDVEPASTNEPDTSASGVSARRLVSEVSAIAWAELRESGRSVEGAGAFGEGAALCDALDDALDDETDLFSLRTNDGCVIATRTQPGTRRSIWCVLPNGAAYGAAMATLARLGALPYGHEGAPTETKGAWRVGLDAHPALDEIARWAEFSQVRAVFVLDATGAVLAGVGRGERPDTQTRALVQKRELLLQRTPAVRVGSSLAGLGFDRKQIVTAEGDVLCFGADVDGPDERCSVWLVVDRQTSLAVGWAWLSSLARVVEKARGDGGAAPTRTDAAREHVASRK
jgi:hypothetical protein